MLVEPGMLLIYRSADKHPRLTDMLVEYLYDYANIYDPGRVEEAFVSIKKVFIPTNKFSLQLSFNHSRLDDDISEPKSLLEVDLLD